MCVHTPCEYLATGEVTSEVLLLLPALMRNSPELVTRNAQPFPLPPLGTLLMIWSQTIWVGFTQKETVMFLSSPTLLSTST